MTSSLSVKRLQINFSKTTITKRLSIVLNQTRSKQTETTKKLNVSHWAHTERRSTTTDTQLTGRRNRKHIGEETEAQQETDAHRFHV